MPPQIFRPCPLKYSELAPSDIETLPPQMFRPCPIRFSDIAPSLHCYCLPWFASYFSIITRSRSLLVKYKFLYQFKSVHITINMSKRLPPSTRSFLAISARKELLLLLVLLFGTYLSFCMVPTFLFYFFATLDFDFIKKTNKMSY